MWWGKKTQQKKRLLAYRCNCTKHDVQLTNSNKSTFTAEKTMKLSDKGPISTGAKLIPKLFGTRQQGGS